MANSVAALKESGGHITVDLVWADHLLASAAILSREGGECVIHTASPVRIQSLGLRSERAANGGAAVGGAASGYTLRFKAEPGRRYLVSRMPS